jgi:RecA-family ATPase
MTTQERARLWLDRVPPSVSGANGHGQCMTAARGLVWGFCLSTSDAMDLLCEWNRSCQPPWSQRELDHKIEQALSIPFGYPKGYLLNAGGPAMPVEKVDLRHYKLPVKKLDPVPAMTHSTMDTNPAEEFRAFLLAAFAQGEIVCICNDLTPEGKPQSAGAFLAREAWIEKFASDDSSLLRRGGLGAFVRINPFVANDFSGADKSVSSFRHVLVEMDAQEKATQEKILRDSGLPISVLIDSGGKSIHAWVRVDAVDRAQWDERRDVIYETLAAKGIDPKNKNPSRYSRLPGADRDGSQQRLLATRIGADTFENWQADIDLAADESTSISVGDLMRFDATNDPDSLIGNRWLTRGSSMILSGGSGIGKSSLLMQLVVQWAMGHPWFGIQPCKPLRIGVIQAENNTGDLAEAFQGVIKAKGDAPPDVETAKLLATNLMFRTETIRTGPAFLDYARRFIVKEKLDLVICDPLLSYFGGDLSDQESVSVFLRNQLQPILQTTGVCWVWIHHISKPAKEKDGEPPTLMELAYSGFGSSELTNWAREIAVIQEVGHHKPRKFRLAFCKRGGRLKQPVLHIAHAPEGSGISWVEWNPLTYQHQKDGQSQGQTQGRRGGRRASR